MGPYREYCVEEKNPLSGPFFQISVVRNVAAKIVMQLLIDIDQGRRDLYVRPDGKAQSVGLSVSVLGILSENHNFDLAEGSRLKGMKDFICRRIDLSGLIFFSDSLI